MLSFHFYAQPLHTFNALVHFQNLLLWQFDTIAFLIYSARHYFLLPHFNSHPNFFVLLLYIFILSIPRLPFLIRKIQAGPSSLPPPPKRLLLKINTHTRATHSRLKIKTNITSTEVYGSCTRRVCCFRIKWAFRFQRSVHAKRGLPLLLEVGS